MAIITDLLMLAATLTAGVYCIVLSKRLKNFTDLEEGVGGAIAILSVQVDDLTKALKDAQSQSQVSSKRLSELTSQAETYANKLEMLLSTMHDLPTNNREKPKPNIQRSRRNLEDVA